jgi:hypothetical protein
MLNTKNIYVLPTEPCIYFVRFSELEEIIFLHSIRLNFISQPECLPRGTNWIFAHNSG